MSTTYAYNTYVWGVNFYYGDDGYSANYSMNNYFNYVRAVRGGQSQPAYVDNGNGTVTDTSTGLMWQQATVDCLKFYSY